MRVAGGFYMIQAQTIQKAVIAVAETPSVLLVPLAITVAVCLAAGYSLLLGLYLISAADGGYDPVVGALTLAAVAGNSSCIAEVLLLLNLLTYASSALAC